jgi:hypothetical protein
VQYSIVQYGTVRYGTHEVLDPVAPHFSASISAHRIRHAEGEREEKEEEGSVCGVEGVREVDNGTDIDIDTDIGRENQREGC